MLLNPERQRERSTTRIILFVAGLLIAIAPAMARGPHPSPGDEFYRSTDGQLTHRPTQGSNPGYGRVTATCRDGPWSYSHHHSGTCTRHRGVAEWGG